MTDTEAKRILEALLLVSDKPLLLEQARETIGADFQETDLRRALLEMAEEYAAANRGMRIVEVAEGFQLVTDPELYPYVTRLTHRVKTVRLSRPALETLAIIAYRQPLTRVEIEQVRGVDASGVLDTLLKFNLIKVTGRKEVVGRPLLYGTTREFLDHFGLKSLENLPTLEELKAMAGPVAPVPAGEPNEPVNESTNPQSAAQAD
ncbi:MAG: SMC-Scp complex subunit ScpB [Candidatus Omnitrophica bacterium]|nr:SMC-Scp complex subunit ScpB [Candidatus Omnitrophota bacterium]